MKRSFFYSFNIRENREQIYNHIDFTKKESAYLNLQILADGALFFSEECSNKIIKINNVCPLLFILLFNDSYYYTKLRIFNIQTYWDSFSGYDIDFNIEFVFQDKSCIVRDLLMETEVILKTEKILKDLSVSSKEIYQIFTLLYPKLKEMNEIKDCLLCFNTNKNK